MMKGTTKKISVREKSTDFRKATHIITSDLPASLSPTEILVETSHLGVNASDVNWTAGKYPPRPEPPFDAGFEAIGRVIAKGDKVKFPVGSYVVLSHFGSFAEKVVCDSKFAFVVPSGDPTNLPIALSGVTASIALEQSARMSSGETVLVTAAAGGTGQFAVQLAKLSGNHVIGTCGDASKIPFLKKIGCDRVINYKTEKLQDVLRSEYPKGVDIVYESVGGDTYQTCLNNLAVGGRLVIIGMISGYQSGAAFKEEANNSSSTPLPAKLLYRSAAVIGFFMPHYAKHIRRHFDTLISLQKEGKLISCIDPHQFNGLDQVADAIDFLYSGKNIGKVMVNIANLAPLSSKL
eukprot:TRINITY_DN5371_c0_g1_i1.p1 TRINITY_DN5371_c0_g1~~TRINITY_DN5371_c0_g1_i1.p1  ORF type:complete len:349 (-),score=117.58 TRINITY_DN5371_c0_g1_i1:131-1177(-)